MSILLYPQFFFRTNYYSIEIPHGVTAISLTYVHTGGHFEKYYLKIAAEDGI